MLLDLCFDHMVSVSGTIYVLYDGKVKTNILLENFNNCYIMLSIHLMKII